MNSSDAYDALKRTAQLLRVDVFHSDPTRDREIVAGLQDTKVRIVADRRTAISRGGQTAIVTLFCQLEMMGIEVQLDVPDLDLVAPQPPLRAQRLAEGLLDYAEDLIPGGSSVGSQRPDLIFVMGNAKAAGAHVRLSWTDDTALVVPASQSVPSPSGNKLPFGAIAAAVAGAAEGIRAAIPVIAEHLDVAPCGDQGWRNPGTRSVKISLAHLFKGLDPKLGDVDAISGGAIMNACLYSLLRIPDLAGRLRVIEPERLDMSNLNRYALTRRSNVGDRKIDALSGYSTNRFEIVGEDRRLDRETVAELEPFAAKVLVGVDDIPSRWIAQEHCYDKRLIVGSTSHNFVLVSEHEIGTACAGCVHTKDDDTAGPIPTIAFVSLLAGMLQAARLLATPSPRGLGIDAWPLGLDGRRGIRAYTPTPARPCPVGCGASRRADRLTG